ncbi:hypothetical protein CABS03_04698 [Colletotrichum abscissum]|uniref:Uncharacterized protein n=1 Tax=Colletotrichum abscissum TaxID=1671311 RepID=A0A9Q0AY36_9PEZI|nr:hypothetical protein CABS02_12226 [Colletotrichum abscissum]
MQCSRLLHENTMNLGRKSRNMLWHLPAQTSCSVVRIPSPFRGLGSPASVRINNCISDTSAVDRMRGGLDPIYAVVVLEMEDRRSRALPPTGVGCLLHLARVVHRAVYDGRPDSLAGDERRDTDLSTAGEHSRTLQCKVNTEYE